MNIKLVVKHPFTLQVGAERTQLVIGDEITGAAEIAAAKASHPSHVLAVDADAKETPWISHEPSTAAQATPAKVGDGEDDPPPPPAKIAAPAKS